MRFLGAFQANPILLAGVDPPNLRLERVSHTELSGKVF